MTLGHQDVESAIEVGGNGAPFPRWQKVFEEKGS